MFCVKCGRELNDGDAFCAGCGNKVGGEKAETETSVTEKLSSEEFLRKKLNNRKSENTSYYIEPNIPEKILVNAASRIADNVNPATIMCVYDSSILSSGKEGIVFTGVAIYLKSAFCSMVKILLDEIEDVDYTVDIKTDSNGKEIKRRILTISYENGEELVVDSDAYTNSELEFVAELLKDFISTVEEVEDKSYRYNSLSDLGDEIIGDYISIISQYLKSDDGVIDSVEYKELIALMARIKVSKELAKELREQRLSSEKSEIDLLECVAALSNKLKKKKMDDRAIFQSLFKDLLLVREENLDGWKNDAILCGLKDYLKISEEQIDVLVTSIKTDKRIVDERLEDNQVKEVANEVAAVAGGAGVTLAALAVTGGVSSGIWGGLFTLGMMSTGGMLLGLAAIGGVGYGAYKGIKYFSGTSQLEKSGIRIAALQSSIENNKLAVTYIIEDVNWLTNKIQEMFSKVKENENLDDELSEELERYLSYMDQVGESGSMLQEKSAKEAYEINIAKLPLELSIGKFRELVAQSPDRAEIEEYIMSIYQMQEVKSDDADEENSYVQTVYKRADELAYEDAEKTYNFLNLIGYYDTKASAIAQGQAITKKGLNVLKGFLGG